MPQTLNRQEIRRQGMMILREKLGVRGFITFIQDLGLSYGNYTEERKKGPDRSIEDYMREMDDRLPPQPPKQ